ncbi:hypothetical protein [Paraburkholderia diazotrophica]|uniref:Uncharacterized protein n=1 Tax=Paraburkholderia diazotrophica TaxID=667676 RepID=A0A1H7ED16_9BURK|nr:hypothetical protein [Paraburkholderia diazotrophica]SEK11738.1 hypothetical protein SAMN05192539_105325 [Paraburkholderia diazotrophica]
MNRLIDQEIAHISRVMWPALLGDLGGPILSSDYWRKRLHALLDAPAISKAQLCALDSLLLQLDDYERRSLRAYSAPVTDQSTDAREEQGSEPVAVQE